MVAAGAVAAHVQAEAAGCRVPAAADYLEEAAGEWRVPVAAAVSPAAASILPAFNDRRRLPSAGRAETSEAVARAHNVPTSVPAAAVFNGLISAAAVPASFTCQAKAGAECKSAADRNSATAARLRVPILPAAAHVRG